MDTSLSRLNRHAFAIISDAAAEMVDISIEAIDAAGGPKQPKLQDKLIEIGALYDQIMTHVVINDAGTAIIGIQGEDVSVVNALLMCLKNAAGLNSLSQFPTPLTQTIFNFPNNQGFEVGPPGSLLVSNGTTYIVLPPGAAGTVLTSDGAGNLIYSSVVGNGLPAGGLLGQVLKKNSNTPYDVIWGDLVMADISDVTATNTEINILSGVNTGSIGASQINTLVGINTSLTIQQQLDALGDPTLPNGQFWVGDATNSPVAHTPTGDVTFNNAGVFAISPLVIENGDISTTAAISRLKFASGSSNRLVINNNSGVMADAAAILPNRALISDANGIPTHSSTGATQLSYISTLTSNAQTQLDSKLTVNLTAPAQGDTIYYNGSEWVNLPIGGSGEVLTSNGTTVTWGSSTANGLPAGGTTHQVLRKIDNTNYNTEWHTQVFADNSDVVTTFTEINLLSGLTVDATQLNYTTDVTSNIQAQLNNKQSRSLAYNALWVGDASNFAVQLSAGSNDQVLTIVNGAPQWETPSPPGDVSGPGIGNSTDNAIARWNGINGDSLNDSGVIIDDSDNITGVTSLSSGQIDVLNQAELRLHETGSTNYVGIRATGVMGGNYTITLPAAAPSANTSLTYDGADYVWAASGGANAFLDLTDVDEPDYVGHAGQLVAVNGTEDGLVFVAAGAGTVTSVSGTTDRITITGTAADPIVNIAVTYVGQTSITTLGTIATGTWNATNISLAKGGTGRSLTDPNADRILFWDDSGGSGGQMEWLEIGSGLSITGTVLTATGSYTDEQAQDAIGNILTDTATIDFTYDDATPTISAIVIDNSISNAKIRQSAALSVIGRSANSTGNVADISGTNGQVLRVSGTTLAFGSVLSSSITMSTNRLLGRTTAGTGAVEEITVGSGLTFNSTNLKIGGSLAETASFTGGGLWGFGGTGLTSFGWEADAINFDTPIGAAIAIGNDAAQHLHLGIAGGAELNLGSDVPGDMYYRNASDKFVRLAIGSVGQSMIVSDAGLPAWSNMIPKDVPDATYTFLPEDNGKRIRFTNAAGCLATVPLVLPTGWLILAYRGDGAGTVTFNEGVGVTFEGSGTTIPAEETSAALYHRGSGFIEITGSVTAIGTGTVTSVDLDDLVGLATASGGPIVGLGSLTLTLNTQAHNTVFAGPSGLTDPDATPTWRLLVLDDIPNDEWIEESGTTHTLDASENKRVLWISNGAGCTITVPPGLPDGYSILVYRKPTAGTVTFSAGIGVTLEGVALTISTAETGAAVMHQGGDVFALLGALGSGGGGATLFTDLLDVPSSYTGHSLKAVRVNAGETGLEFFTISGTGTVTSVSGTTDRITITGTPSVNPTVDIAATYAGQTSITTLGTIGTGTWQGTSISTTYTDAKVVSVSGTASRISIGGTAANPTVNIDTGYVGQSSITTLGTIGTGVWQGTAVAAGFGGTGQTTYTVGDILYASGTTALSKLADIATGNALISGGVATAPSWGKIGLSTHVSGTLAIANGGTNLTSLGSANQVLGVNNGGTVLEYKSFLLGTTPQSNNLGWVLTTPNEITLHVPDASATVRGVVTTGTQSFAGAKTFTSDLQVGSTTAGIKLSSSSGVITLYAASTSTTIGYSTSTNFLYSTLRWQLPQITFTSNGNTTDTTASTISGSAGSTTHTNRFDVTTANTGFRFATVAASAYGGGNTYGMVSISNSNSPYNLNSSTGTFRSLHITPSINTSGGTSTIYGIHYVSTETSLTGVTHYGLIISGASGDGTALSGFGVAAPTARLQTRGLNNGIAFLAQDDGSNRILELGESGGARYIKMDFGSDATGDIYYRNSSGNLTRLAVGTNGHVLTLSGGLPTWAASGGGGGITNSAVNTELMVSDGTNAEGTKLYSGADGDLTLGDGSLSGHRTLSAVNDTGTLIFNIQNLASTSSIIRLETGFTGLGQIDLRTQDVTVGKGSSTQANGRIRGAEGESSANSGVNLELYGGDAYTTSGDGNGGNLLLRSGEKRSAGSGVDGNIIIDQLTGDLVIGSSAGKLAFFDATAIVKQTSGADLTNNVTSGGTNDQIDDWSSLTVYATDAAAIRNAIYQLSRKLKQINDGLRDYGLFT